MNTYKILIVAGSVILSTLAFSNTAFASDWMNESFTKDKNSLHEQLYAVTSDTTALTFICKAKKFRAAISTTNNNAAQILNIYSETRRRINRKVELTIDGKSADTPKWMINPARKIFVTPDRSTTIKLYNAVVGGKDVSIQRKGEMKYVLDLPPPNQAFANFGANCGIGKLKEG